MSPKEFKDLVREYTYTDENSFSDARILLYMNAGKNKMCRQVVRHSKDYFTTPHTTDLIAGQREYNLPPEMLTGIQRVGIQFVEGGKYIIATERSPHVDNIPLDEATIQAHFTDGKPGYYVLRRALYLLTASPIIDMPNGLQVYAPIFPPNFSNLSVTVDMAADLSDVSVGFPEPLHELLARYVSIAYKNNRTRPIPLTEEEKVYGSDLDEAIAQLASINQKEKLTVRLPYNAGFQY